MILSVFVWQKYKYTKILDDNFIECKIFVIATLYPNLLHITKTYPYNFDPLKPHLYIVKLGFTGVYIIFLISAQKHRLCALVRTATIYVLSRNMKNIRIFLSENFHFLLVTFSVYLNRRVFVMRKWNNTFFFLRTVTNVAVTVSLLWPYLYLFDRLTDILFDNLIVCDNFIMATLQLLKLLNFFWVTSVGRPARFSFHDWKSVRSYDAAKSDKANQFYTSPSIAVWCLCGIIFEKLSCNQADESC